jgi:aminoglycoside phosphotransferase (APT) family kinase protein
MAPHIIYACPDHSCLVTDFLEGRLWTPHYFTRMRDLRSLGQRLRALHAVTPPSLPRFDPLAAARRYAERIVQDDRSESARLESLLESGAASLARSGSARRAATIVHNDLHSGNVITADRLYFIDWEYAQVGDPLLDLASLMTYYPRATAHASLLLSASGLDSRGATPVMLEELTNVFTLLTYLWYRARRISRSVSGTDLAFEFAALRRLQPLAPGAEGRHT